MLTLIRTDLKFDNILFRPSDVPAVVGKALVEEPSLSYNFDTKASSPVVPFLSQPLDVTVEALSSVAELHAVIADVGHCE
jgi:serine/threonine-protein kinase SRPK3